MMRTTYLIRRMMTPTMTIRDSNHAFIRPRHYSGRMLFLSAFARIVPREPEANDLLAESRAVWGHVGLTIIAIVFVLVTFWKS
jgi:hypothetical protein